MPFVWLDGFPFMTTFDFFHAQKCEFQILDLQLMTHVWPPQQKKGWPHTHTGHPIQKFAKTINLPKFNVFHWKVTTDDMQVQSNPDYITPLVGGETVIKSGFVI